jgi:hypothetical protein
MSIEENKAIIRRYYDSFGKEESVHQIRESENWIAILVPFHFLPVKINKLI